jgi:hypothetical protein
MIKSLKEIKNGYSLVNKNKIILFDSSSTIEGLKKQIKKKIVAPNKNIKVYIIDINKPKSSEYVLTINCYRQTITPELKLSLKDGDELYFQTITWTAKEFEKFGLKKTDIFKIIKAIKKNLISFEKNSVSISEVLKNVN